MPDAKEEAKCGTRYKYIKRKCRCELCKEAIAVYNKERARRKREVPHFPLQPVIDRMTKHQRGLHETLIKTSSDKSLSVYRIDRLCCSLGFHPYEVYGDLWYEDIWNSEKEFRKPQR
jgi:hypothetical protein